MNPVRVLLVDDHMIWRGGLKSMLQDTEFEVIGEAATGAEGVEMAVSLSPGLVLLDIRMPDRDGLEALEAIKADRPQLPVVMLTTYENPTYTARAVALGAAGYLLKGIGRDELLGKLRAVAEGETLLTPSEFVRSLRETPLDERVAAEADVALSKRELEVLRLLATGLNNRDIGHILLIAESTVKTHVEHIVHKLGVSDRLQAAVWAARQGLLENETE